MTMVGYETVKGKKVELHVNGNTGKWTAKHGKAEVAESATRDGVLSAVRTRFAKAKIKLEIPVTLVEGSRWGGGLDFTSCNLTGVHSGSGNITYHDGNRAKQATWHGNNQFYRRISAAEMKEWKRLYKAKHDADAAFTAFQSEREVNAKQLVEEAIAKAEKASG